LAQGREGDGKYNERPNPYLWKRASVRREGEKELGKKKI